MSFTIVSYYTIDTPYYQVAHDYLMPSVQKLGLRSDIRGVQNLGSWQKNTAYKASFVLQMLEKHNQNIVFLDADAVIMEEPKIFESIPTEYNFAFHILDRNTWYGQEYGENRYELLSGTAFFRNCPETIAKVKTWQYECIVNPHVWEQKILERVLKEDATKIFNLPIEYCYINSLPNGSEPIVKVTKPVIVHHQASRLHKNSIR